jgi:hypothetical protein
MVASGWRLATLGDTSMTGFIQAGNGPTDRRPSSPNHPALAAKPLPPHTQPPRPEPRQPRQPRPSSPPPEHAAARVARPSPIGFRMLPLCVDACRVGVTCSWAPPVHRANLSGRSATVLSACVVGPSGAAFCTYTKPAQGMGVGWAVVWRAGIKYKPGHGHGVVPQVRGRGEVRGTSTTSPCSRGCRGVSAGTSACLPPRGPRDDVKAGWEGVDGDGR